MSKLCVPDTTMGVRFFRSLVFSIVAMGTIRFIKARVTTECTSPICPAVKRSLMVKKRRRKRCV